MGGRCDGVLGETDERGKEEMVKCIIHTYKSLREFKKKESFYSSNPFGRSRKRHAAL